MSSCPICSPSRSSLLTGQYPTSHGTIKIAHRGFAINDYSKHFVPFLKDNSYYTVLCGVQHEASMINGDENIGYPSKNKLENGNRASDWIKGHAKDNKPFFLSYGCFSTHRPHPNQKILIPIMFRFYILCQIPPETREDFAKFQTMVNYFDQGFGKVIQALKETGLYDNTIIIYTTDHGVASLFCKGMLFDTGIGVSLAIRVLPNKLQGEVVDGMVSQIDFFLTI